MKINRGTCSININHGDARTAELHMLAKKRGGDTI
jgi:hypothetical protein